MSTIIDEKIVSMKFDNEQFQNGTKETISSLEALKKAIDRSADGTAFTSLDKAAKSVDLSGIAQGIDILVDRFSTLGIIGMRVIENIADGIMNGIGKAVNFATDAIVSGGIKRAMNIENAHFQLQGLIDDEKEVKAIMDDALDSVDGTAYAYDEAAKAASMFAASGLKSGTQMQNALRAIAGVAATTNSDYESLAQIFTTVAGQGKLMSLQLNQLAVRGMNGAAALTKYINGVNGFGNETIEASENVKKAVKEITNGVEITEADLRELIKDSKISFEIFSEGMATTFGDHAKDANKTFNGAMANIRSAFARTGAYFVSPLIKQEGPMVELFNAIRIKVNEMNKAIEPFANLVTYKLNKAIPELTKFVEQLNFTVLDENKNFKANGVIMENFFNILKSGLNIFKAVQSVLKPIKEAFKDVFSFKDINISEIITKFKNFTLTLTISDDKAKKLKETFTTIFKYIRDIGKEAINFGKNIFGTLKALASGLEPFTKVLKSSGSLLESFAEFVLNSVKNINKFLTETDFSKPFERFKKAVENVSNVISGLIDLVSHVSFGTEFKGIELSFGGLTKVFDVFKQAYEAIKPVIEEFFRLITKDPAKLANGLITGAYFSTLVYNIQSLKDTIQDAQFNIKLFTNTAEYFFKPLQNATKILGNAALSLGELKEVLQDMQAVLQVEVILKLAKAILTLSIAMLVMDSLDTDILARNVGIIITLISTLGGVMYALTNTFKEISILKISSKHPIIGAIGNFLNSLSGVIDSVKYMILINSIYKLAKAVVVLAIAMRIIADLSWEEIIKGLVAVGVLLTELIFVVDALSGIDAPRKLTFIGIGMIELSIAIVILSNAVEKLGNMDFWSLIKGLAAVGGLIFALAKFVGTAGGWKHLASIGFGLMEVAIAIKILESSMRNLSQLKWSEILKGLSAIGGLLLGLGVFTKLAGGATKMIRIGVSMMLLAVAIKMLAEPLQTFGNFSWNDIIKSLIMFDVVLGELVMVMKGLPKNTVVKSAGIIIFAQSIKMIADALTTFGKMNFWDSVQALIMFDIVLGELITSLKGIPKDTIVKAAGLIVFAEAIKMLTEPLLSFASMNLWDSVQALVMLGLTLAELIIALDHMPDAGEIIGKSIGMVILAESVKILSEALLGLGAMTWEQAAVSVVSLGLTLAILCKSLDYLSGFKWGEIAKSVLALAGAGIALILIVPMFKMLGDMSWDQIGHACLAMAVALGILIGAFAIVGAAKTTIGIGAAILLAAVIGLASVIAIVVTIISKAAQLLTDSITTIVASIKSLTDSKPEEFKSATELIGDAISIIGKSLKSFGIMAPVGAKALKTASEGLSVLIPALTEFAKLETDTDISDIFEDLADGFKYLADGLKAFDIWGIAKTQAEALKYVAEAVDILVPPVTRLMNNTNLEKFDDVMTTLGNGFKTFGEALEATPFWGASSRAKGIKSLTEGVAMLAEGLPPLMELDANQFNAVMITLGNSFKLFGQALDEAPFWSPKERAEGIKSLVDAIETLGNVLPNFLEQVDSDSFLDNMALIGKGFVEFGTALQSTPIFNTDKRGAGIAALVDSVMDLASGVSYFEEIVDANTFEATMVTVGNAFEVFGQSLKSAPLFNADERGQGIATIVESLKSLAEGVKALKDIDGDGVQKILDTLGKAILDFGTAIGKTGGVFGIGVDKQANGISSVINALTDLIPPIKDILAIDDIDKVKRVLFILGYSIKDFVMALNDINFWGADTRSSSLTSLINDIGDIVPVLEKVCKLDQEKVKSVLFAIGYSLKEFVSVVNSLKFGSDDKADTMGQIIDAVVQFGSINYANMYNVINMMDEFIDVLGKLNAIDLKDQSSLIENLGNVASTAAKTFEGKFLEAIPSAKDAVNEFLEAIITKIKDKDRDFNSRGYDSSRQYLEGFRKNLEVATTFGVSLANKVLAGIKSVSFTSAGENAAWGFINGLNSKTQEAINAGTNLANAAYNASKNALKEHSPSKKMFEVGSYAGEGFVKGFVEWTRAAVKAGNELGISATDGVNDAIKKIDSQIQNGVDLTPVITPVIDLDNLKKEANQIGGIIDLSTPVNLAQNASLSFSGGISRMLENLEASIPENSNDDVVDAIDKLNSNMIGVMNSLGNLQVVLDTGTMVGELVNPIDEVLGFNQVLVERGVRA